VGASPPDSFPIGAAEKFESVSTGTELKTLWSSQGEASWQFLEIRHAGHILQELANSTDDRGRTIFSAADVMRDNRGHQ
jgi:hypothetical protein